MGKRNERDSGGDQRGVKGGKRFRGASAKESLTGPAIWATCLRNKERKAADELIDYLEEIADRLYPNVTSDYQPPTPPTLAVYENSEDEMDAMMNGASSSSKAPAPSAPQKEPETTEKKPVEPELDIESQIQAELAELQEGRKGSRPSKEKSNDSQKPKPKARRFRSLDTDTECLLFIACAAPYDPYVLVQALLEEVEKTGEARSRFIMRLTPSSETCYANEEDIAEMSQRILPAFFKATIKDDENSIDGNSLERKPFGVEVTAKQLKPGPITFKIDVRKRSSDFSRDRLLSTVANAVPREGGHHADLKNAGEDGLIIVVMILRNVCAISVNANYERFRKYNMLETAELVRKDAEEGRVAKGGKKEESSVKEGENLKEDEGAPSVVLT